MQKQSARVISASAILPCLCAEERVVFPNLQRFSRITAYRASVKIPAIFFSAVRLK